MLPLRACNHARCCPGRHSSTAWYSGCSSTTRMIWSSSGSIGRRSRCLRHASTYMRRRSVAALVVEHRHQRVPRACRRPRLRLSRPARRLRLVFAEIDHGADRAFGFARFADVAAVQQQPVMRVQQEFRRHALAAAAPRPRAACRRARARAGSRRGRYACRPASSACRRRCSSTTFAVLRPTPGSSSSASRCCGTAPPCFSSRIRHVARMFFTLPGYSPIVAHIRGQAFLPEREDRRGRIRDRKQLAASRG